MSHDLHFVAHPGFDLDALERDLLLRRFWSNRGSFLQYANPITEVSFVLERFEPEADSNLLPLFFNLEYRRPHVFGLEANEELSWLCDRFRLEVIDPQCNPSRDATPRPFTTCGFSESYNAGVRASLEVLFHPDQPGSAEAAPFTLPSSLLGDSWRWNHRVSTTDSTELDRAAVGYLDVFGIAQVMTADEPRQGRVIPAVDVWVRPRGDRLAAVPMDALRTSLDRHSRSTDRHSRSTEELGGWRLGDDIAGLLKAMRSASAEPMPIRRLELREILDREWVEEIRGRARSG